MLIDDSSEKYNIGRSSDNKVTGTNKPVQEYPTSLPSASLHYLSNWLSVSNQSEIILFDKGLINSCNLKYNY